MRSCNFREDIEGVDGGLEALFAQLETNEAAHVQTLERNGLVMASARFDRLGGEDNSLEFIRFSTDLCVLVVDARLPGRLTMPVVGEDFIEFHFRLSGALSLVDAGESLEVPEGVLLVWRQPRGSTITESLVADARNRESSVTIYCRPSFIQRCFGAVTQMLDPGLAGILDADCARIVSLQAALYPALTRLVLDLAGGRERSQIGLVRAEALAVQVVAEVLANASFQRRTQCGTARLTDRDVVCLNAARQILIATFAPAPTIEVLARKVGLSPTKLKFGFRLLFGQTIAEFANELRMSTARDLLRKSDKPIAHVSAELGYEYQNSFTVAFRRRFGILPKDYRRNPLNYDHRIRGAA